MPTIDELRAAAANLPPATEEELAETLRRARGLGDVERLVREQRPVLADLERRYPYGE